MYDIIVVGAGHAGCEAAAAAANLGSRVLLLTMNLQTIGQMSCNPAMGGIAKGQIVREIDAMGGLSGIVSDESTIQFRMLNRSKGPAMWSPRTQNDRQLFSATWREKLERIPTLFFYQDMATKILIKNQKAIGVLTVMGETLLAKAVVLTGGTFLNGQIHIGEKQIGGGRSGEQGSNGISNQLASEGLTKDRLKTGTPPRIDGRSLNYSLMEEQKGDEEIVGFSFSDSKKIHPQSQKSCFITYTNSAVHDILKTGFDKSPMYQKRIEGRGPRYCPSIEDKISRFAEKDRHQLFVEPEGFNTIEIYLNGFSSSLPQNVQINALRQIKGFENCKIFRPGYAIEYDYFHPTQLQHSLETKPIKNLFFAGQINGTTGYEEAACQGLMAGINAHLKINEKPAFVLTRSEAYIGVLIDDLISKGTEEPYRMFTSRAEFRILLRQDNADARLTQKGYTLGLASAIQMDRLEKKLKFIEAVKNELNTCVPTIAEANAYLQTIHSTPIQQKQTVAQLLLRPNTNLKQMEAAIDALQARLTPFDTVSKEEAEIQIKYKTYLLKEMEMVEKIKMFDELIIPPQFDYEKLNSISTESKQKFVQIKPQTLGQASRISGVSPSDVQILMLYLRR